MRLKETVTFVLDSKGNICFRVMQSDDLYKLGYVIGVAMPENPLYNEGRAKILGVDQVIYTIIVPSKVKCLNTNGKVSSVQALTDMQSSQVIRFSEKEGVLTAYEIASDDENYEGLHKIAKLGNGNNIDTQYWKDAALIGGRIPVDSDTVIILTDLTKDSTDEKAYSFIAMSALGDEQYYPDTVGYRVGTSDIHSDIVISPYDKPLTKNAPILLISEVYKEYDAEKDTVKVVLEGYNKNEIKKLVLYENELLTYTTVDGKEIELGAGDCIRYVINSKDEIKKVKLMFDYSDMKMYGINDGDDLSYAYGAKELHRTGQVASVHGDYVKLLIDGVGAEDYLYSLKTAELYQVSEKNGQTLCEAISSYDVMSLKNNPELKDKVFTMLVYGDTRVMVVYKSEE